MKKMMIALTIALGIAASNVNAGLFDFIGDAADKVSGAVSSAFGKVKSLASSAISKVTGVISQAMGGLSSSAQKLVDKMNNDITQYNDAAMAGDAEEATKQYDQLVDRLKDLKKETDDQAVIDAFATVIAEIEAANGW